MAINIYTLTSLLHDPKAIDASTHQFLSKLNCSYEFRGNNYANYGNDGLDLIYVRTGGTEGLFKEMLDNLNNIPRKFYLLTSGLSNSLAASMEILSYLNNNGMNGEILHGSPEYINKRITQLELIEKARTSLAQMKLGVIGKPSDWLISSGVDYAVVKEKLGVTLVDIEMDEVLDAYNAIFPQAPAEIAGKAFNDEMKQRVDDAWRLYLALKEVVKRHGLSGFTIRCFDLLSSIRNTGCLALAQFNANGIIATCEGDIPAMLSMAISQSLTGVAGFQANPATINPETGEMLFAHCTIPFNMVERYELDTHFESSLGVGIRGFSKPGPVTVFKVSGDLSRHFAQEGKLVKCQGEPQLCRTQQVIALDDKDATKYFLTHPIGNHHIIMAGSHKLALDELLS